MEFTVTNQDNNQHIVLKGQFTFSDNQQFKQVIALLQDKATHTITLDFSQVSFIDSAGLGMLLLLRDECQKKNIRISLHSVQGQVEKIFLISKFDQLFSVSGEK